MMVLLDRSCDTHAFASQQIMIVHRYGTIVSISQLFSLVQFQHFFSRYALLQLHSLHWMDP